MTIQRVGQIVYGVTEIGAAVPFYRDVLGLVLKFTDGAQWAAFNLDGVTVALSTEAGGGPRPGKSSTGPMVAFRVDDIHAFAERLQAASVKISAVTEGGHELRLEVTDPDGNVLMFYQPKASSSVKGN